MADANTATIQRFFAAFNGKNGAGMAACYSPEATFSDPAFVGLRGRQVGCMWKMLTARSKEFSLTFSDVAADASSGSSKWIAHYLFGPHEHKVVNHVTSNYTFDKDGKILTQVDTFDFWAWSSQAIGLPGRLLGWTSFLQRKVQAQARGQLDAWMAKNPNE
jgi:hypothetical protein